MNRDSSKVDTVHVHQDSTEVVYTDAVSVFVDLEGSVISAQTSGSATQEQISKAREIATEQVWIVEKRKRLFG